MTQEFGGVSTALVTPFLESKEIDWNSLSYLVNDQLKSNISSIVIHGTTAESPTLSLQEVQELVEKIGSQVAGQKKIIFGAGLNSTDKTIEFIEKTQSKYIDALLVVVPYYNKPNQRGLEAHFLKIAEASEKPIILYNVPSRTVVGLSGETLVKLSSHPNIIGIKEASGDLDFLKQYQPQTPKDFFWLSGDDDSAADFMKLGGHGCISVISNLFPNLFDESLKTTLVSEKLKKAYKIVGKDTNPIMIKEMLSKAGLIQHPDLRLPLLALDPEKQKALEPLIKELL